MKIKSFFKKNKELISNIIFAALVILVVTLAALLVLYGFGVVYFDDGVQLNTVLFDSFKNSWYGWMVIIFVQVVLTTLLCFVPGFSMTFILLLQTMFDKPWQSFLVAFIGVMLTSLAMYFTGRFGGYKFCKRMLGEKDCLRASELLNNKGAVYFPLMMMFPLFPDDALVMIAGTLRMSLKWFLPSVVFGRGIGIATIVFGLGGIPFERFTSIWHWVAFILICALGLVAVFYMAYRFNEYLEKRKKMNNIGNKDFVEEEKMKYASPEKCGISSEAIKEYIDRLENSNLSTHDIIIARGNNILFEKYWEPFGPDDTHRMYSVSKSFISLAVGFAIQDGLVSLDDKMIDRFPKELEDVDSGFLRNQTVRDMLMMSTAMAGWTNWFTADIDDRVNFYFHNITAYKRPGKTFLYDSTGSFVLDALVERVTGMPFMDYLRVKLFDKIGVSKSAHCLKSPGGHSWGDSAVLCTPRDLLLVARFVLNGGRWNGEQILNEEYIKEATSNLIDTDLMGVDAYNRFGYGYLIWRTYDNSFFFNGMANQFAICVPDKDIVFIYNADNQGHDEAKEIVIRSFFELIARKAVDGELPENKEAEKALVVPLKLMAAKGKSDSSFKSIINDKKYVFEPNPMGIKELSLHFDEVSGEMRYVNEQGSKVLRFGVLENVVDPAFPQEGYSKDVGGKRTTGHFYRYAASAAWTREDTVHIKVQIIDDYFGRLDIRLQFFDDGSICVRMKKTAENFLNEYNGIAYGTTK